MSQWTHIRGGFELRSPACEFKRKSKDINKDVYLPFPEEQMKLEEPLPTLDDETKDVGLTFEVNVYSLPRAKKYIEEAFNLLPQGETGWEYSISQQRYNSYLSSSCFDYTCETKEFERQIMKMYDVDKLYKTFKDFNKDNNISLSFVNYITGIVIGVREDIRDCTGDELLKSLEKFFSYLRQHYITVEDGYLEWEDYFSEYRYAWRCSRLSSKEVYSFMMLDKKTNKIIWKKTCNYPTLIDENGKKKTDYFAEELVTTVWKKKEKKDASMER